MLTKKQVKMNPIWKNALKQGELVYAMEQGRNLTVTDMPGTRGAKAFYAKGICHGISLYWIGLRKNGRDYEHKTYEDNISICHKIPLQPYKLQLAPSKGIHHDLKKQGFKIVSSKENIPNLSKSYLLSLVPKLSGQYAYFASKGHAMAVQKKGMYYHFLDPNWGHFRFEGVAAYQKCVRRIIVATKYKGPFEAHIVV